MKKILIIIASATTLGSGLFLKKKVTSKLVASGHKKPTQAKFSQMIKLVNYGLPQKVTVAKKAGKYPVEEKKTKDGIIIVLKNTLIGAPKDCWLDQQVIFS